MNNKTEIKLEGTSEIISALDALNPKNLINIIRAVERKVLNQYIIKPLRSVIGHQSLKKAVGIEKYRGNDIGYSAGITVGKREDSDHLPIGVITKLLDQGTDIRTTKRGANRGQIIGKNQIQPTITSNIENVVKYFNEDFGEEVDKILEKKIKKLNK